jgi:predicted nucleotide-binding protein
MARTDTIQIFVASSSEQVKVAEKVATEITKAAGEWKEGPVMQVDVWNKNIFDFSRSYIESLEKQLDLADFAIIILTADDTGKVRENTVNLPRDNVIYELGLFTGRLGRNRCFLFVDGESETQIASDLSGVKSVVFYKGNGSSSSAKPGLSAQVKAVLNQMLELNVRYKLSPAARTERDQQWRFACRISGHWWERMRRAEDDMSALTFVTITVDDAVNSPHLEGAVFDREGKYIAEWKSIIAGVILGAKPRIYYRWEGKHDATPGQEFGGGGVINFDNLQLESGGGYFYDTNFALLDIEPTTRRKHFGLYRCSAEEVKLMQDQWSDDAKTLRQHKLKTLIGR